MSIEYRYETFDARALLAGKLSLAQREKAFGKWCQAQTDLVDAQNAASAGIAIPKTLSVDGETVDRFRRVPLDATARVDWRQDYEVVKWIWDAIHRLSPVRSGRYRSSHVLLADGVAIPEPDPSIRADRYVIVSPLVYARKIEGNKGGIGKRPPQSPAAPNGVYAVVEALAKREFKNVRVTYTLETLYSTASGLGAKSVTAWATAKHGATARLVGTRASRIAYRNLMSGVRNPAIVISFR